MNGGTQVSGQVQAVVVSLPFSQSVAEADIDWIICMELNCDPLLRSQIGVRIFGFEPTHIRAWRSVMDQLGESDLIWMVSDSFGHRHIALIENKIDAVAQPQQCTRYGQRGSAYCKTHDCVGFRTVLLAPALYTSIDSADYQVRISYEELNTWFGALNTDRGIYMASLIDAAITKARSTPPPDPATTSYREQVWQLAQAEFPHLGIDKPPPTREAWVMQKYDGYFIKYKHFATFAAGYHKSVVDIELAGQANDVEALRARYSEELARIGARVEQASKSAAFRIEVSAAKPPEFDKVITREALEAWDKLLKWWRTKNVRVAELPHDGLSDRAAN